MKCNFVVGQKVVCIGDREDPGGCIVVSDHIKPEIGKIYTVRGFKISNVSGAIGVKLEEISDQRVDVIFNGHYGTASLFWHPDDFRPLIARKTDISIFKAMLTPKNEQVAA